MTSWSSVEWKSKRWFGLIENQKHCGFGVSENQKGVLGVDLRWRMVTWRAPGYKDQMKGRVLQDLIKTSMNGCYYRCSCQLKEYEVWRKGHIDKNVEDVLKLIFDSHQIYRMYFRWIEVSQCLGWNKIPEAKPKEYIS